MPGPFVRQPRLPFPGLFPYPDDPAAPAPPYPIRPAPRPPRPGFGARLFGRGNPMEGLLETGDRTNAGNQGLLAAGASLLEASGPHPGSQNALLPAIGQALTAGREGYGQAVGENIQGQMAMQQIGQQQQQMQQQERRRQILASLDMSGATSLSDVISKYRGVAAELLRGGDVEGAKEVSGMAQSMLKDVKFGNPVELTGPDGKPMMVQFADDGTIRPLNGAQPAIDTTTVDVGDKQLLVNDRTGAPIAQYDKGTAPASAENGFVNSLRMRVAESDLRQEYTKLPQIQSAIIRATALGQVEQSARDADTTGSVGDLAMITSFMKMIDPLGTVRESDMANAATAAGFSNTVTEAISKVLGKGTLSHEVRQRFVTEARGYVGSQRKELGTTLNRYSSYATSYGYNPQNVIFDPYADLSEAAASAPDGSSSSRSLQDIHDKYGDED